MRHGLIGLGVFCVVVAGFWSTPIRTAGQDEPLEIAQPANWVAFDADLQILPAGRAQETKGRFFRSSDGSDRLETWDSQDPSVKVISIRSIPRASAFYYSPRIGWNSNPMTLPLGGWHPLRYRKGMQNLTLRSDRMEGFELYQLIGAAGDVQFLAPALNFFPMVRQHVKDGERWTYSNIQVREQDAALFEPPPGVSITAHATAIGIVVGKSNDGLTSRKNGPSCSTQAKPK